MGFKNFYETQEIIFKYPSNSGKVEKKIALKEYKNLVDLSNLPKRMRKDLKSRIDNRQDIPIYCEEADKFFMVNLMNSKCKEIKSREDKVACGVLFNAMLKESKEKKDKLYEHLKQFKLPWDAPVDLYIV